MTRGLSTILASQRGLDMATMHVCYAAHVLCCIAHMACMYNMHSTTHPLGPATEKSRTH